jgi:hypothetical protein
MYGGWALAITAAAKKKRIKELLTEVIDMPALEAAELVMKEGFHVRILSIDGVTKTPDGQFNTDRIGIVISGGLVKGSQIG